MRVGQVTEELKRLVWAAENVLFDFDGPICRLFAGRSAQQVSENLESWLDAEGRGALLTKDERGGGPDFPAAQGRRS